MPIRDIAEGVRRRIVGVEVFAVIEGERIPIDEAEEVSDILLIKMTDEDGHIEEFAIDFWEYADEERFREILNNWITNIFPKRKAAKTLSGREKAEMAREIKRSLINWLRESS